MKNRLIWPLVAAWLFIGMLAIVHIQSVFYIKHLEQVVHDQKVYIDAGAQGRYEGEEQ